MSDIILVTGATGTVGSEVIKQLSALGARVRAAAHSEGKADKIKDLGVEIVKIDYNKPETLKAAFKGVEKLFLLTPLVQNMVEMTANLVEQARLTGVKHIVKQSGLGADVEPGISLGRWHRQAEKLIEDSGISFTLLRPNSFMQNFVNLFGYTIKTQGAFYLPVGDGKVSYVDVRDIAAVASEVLTKDGHEGKAYDITGPETLSHFKIAEILSNKLGKKISYVDVTEDDARKGLQDAGVPEWLVDALMELYGIQKAGYASAVSPAVKEVAGREPISFAKFTEDYAEAFN